MTTQTRIEYNPHTGEFEQRTEVIPDEESGVPEPEEAPLWSRPSLTDKAREQLILEIARNTREGTSDEVAILSQQLRALDFVDAKFKDYWSTRVGKARAASADRQAKERARLRRPPKAETEQGTPGNQGTPEPTPIVQSAPPRRLLRRVGE